MILCGQTPVVNLPAAISCSHLLQDGVGWGGGNRPPSLLEEWVIIGRTPAAHSSSFLLSGDLDSTACSD